MIDLKTILVPSDFSECSDAAIRYGLELARRFDARLHLLHVVQDPATQPWAAEGFALPILEIVEQWQKDARLRLAAAVPLPDAARVTCVATIAAPTDEIVRYASAHAVDLIVMGTHGRGGVSHLLLGSIAEKVIRRAPCPVLTVRHPERDFVVPELELDLVAAAPQA
jgi:nucleotide-binding universal stress UspA family protein